MKDAVSPRWVGADAAMRARRAQVAVARRLAVILHGMWVDEIAFRDNRDETVAA